jgi:hypothetical protein
MSSRQFVAALVASAFSVALAATASAQTVYQVPSSIPTNCSCTSAACAADGPLNTWLAKSVPDYSTVSFKAEACYPLDNSLVLNNRHTLTFEGNAATFKAVTLNSPTRSNWMVTGGSNIAFNNMTIIGRNPDPGFSGSGTDVNGVDYEWQSGIWFSGVQTASVSDVTISSVYGDFITASFSGNPVSDGMGGYVGASPTTGLTIGNSYFNGSGRHGVGADDVEGLFVQNNYIGNVGQAGIDLELDFNGAVGNDVWVLNNTFGAVGFSVFSNGGAGYPGAVGNVWIIGNVQDAPLAIGQESCQICTLDGAEGLDRP